MSDQIYTPPPGTTTLPWKGKPPTSDAARQALSEGPAYTPPPGTGAMFQTEQGRYSDLMSVVHDGAEDPEATLAKVASSVYLADRLGIPAESVYHNYDTYSKAYWGQINPPKKNLEAIRGTYAGTEDPRYREKIRDGSF